MRRRTYHPLIIGLVALCAGAGPARAEGPLGVVSGTTLPTGLGHFADPAVLQGISGGLQGSFGVSSRSQAFGYDNLTATVRWTPGTNWLGLRLSLMPGTASWYTPPLSSIYRAEVLSPEERGAAGQSVSTAVLGVSFRVFGVRDPLKNREAWLSHRRRLAELDLQIARLDPAEAGKREDLTRQRNELLWSEVLRGIVRTPTLLLGALFRAGALGNVADVEAVDAFASFAGGRGIADVVLTFHYLHGFREALVTEHSLTGSAGVFLDLASSPSPPTLGLLAGVGHYLHAPRSALSSSGEPIESAPRTTRIDVGLSFSGAPDSAGTLSAGVGVRYGLLLGSEVAPEHQVLLFFSSGFRFARGGS